MRIIKLTQTTIFLLVSSCYIVVAADDAEQRATIKSIIGQVEVSPDGSGKWRKARANMPVKMGYDLRTFIESSADIELETGALIKIGENTVVTLSKLLGNKSSGASNTGLKIGTGKVWANVKKLTNAKSEFEFETPTAVASIRGTRLGISVDGNGTAVDVFEGLVQVREKSSGKTVSVPTKGRAIVAAGGKGVTYIDLEKAPGPDGAKGRLIDPFVDSSGAHIPQDSAASKGSSGIFSKPVGLTLALSIPKDGEVIAEPMIPIAGTVTAGASVWVNSVSVVVSPSGSFQYKAPIPNEPHEYSVIVVARLGSSETSEERTVVYSPTKSSMFLEISTPIEGQLIRQNPLHLIGKTSPRAVVTINGRSAPVSSQGVISYDLQLAEKDIGEYRLEVAATDESKDLTKTITAIVDIASPLINTSLPTVVVHEQNGIATRIGKLNVDAFDRTPGDQLTLQFQNNGRYEDYAMPPGDRQYLNLDEGINVYTVKAVDKAKNISNVVSGSVYYLPGPLVIEIRDPTENPMIVDDLPPMPKNVAVSRMRIEVEIEDGIGNVPETIRYCRLIGDGKTLQMTGNNNYRYSTEIPLSRGAHVYTVQVEDLSGNIMTKRLDIVIRQ